MELILFTVLIVIAIAVGAVALAFALRAMRPKVPEAQSYVAPTVTARTAASSAAASTASGLTPGVRAEIDRLVDADQKIAAIKVYREHTGVGLKEAKDRIDHWAIGTTIPHPTTPAGPAPTGSMRGSLPPAVAAEIDRLVAGEQIITAIKVLRQHTGLGLRESKNAIEAWHRGA